MVTNHLNKTSSDYMSKNDFVYDKKEIITKYASFGFLFKPEKLLFENFSDFFKTASVLDIGVGGGRTSQFLIPKCLNYVGIDISEGMIEASKKKFQHFTNAKFEVVDATNLNTVFDKESFDFILFSFNGIDCISQEKREKTIENILSLLKPNGYFLYSCHNIRSLPKISKLSLGKNFFKWFERYKRYKTFNSIYPNLSDVISRDVSVIKDGSENFEIEIVYVKPEFEYSRLEKLGFSEIKIFDFDNSKELRKEILSENTDFWLYFLCKK
ncbi:MAG: class I SAM-dependent methyltransferase [Cytophagales bacterium]